MNGEIDEVAWSTQDLVVGVQIGEVRWKYYTMQSWGESVA